MSIFKKHKLKTKEVEVQGEKFTLTEPSALDMCEYWDFVQQEHGKVDDESSNAFKAKVNASTGLMLTAICLKSQFADLTQDEVYKSLCDDITDYGDINIFVDAAEEVSDTKMDTTDSLDGSSDTD